MTAEQAKEWAPIVATGLVVAFFALVYFWIEVFPEWKKALFAWLDKRALIRSARSFGIEYIPGESLADLRQRVITKRDEVIK